MAYCRLPVCPKDGKRCFRGLKCFIEDDGVLGEWVCPRYDAERYWGR